MANTYNEFARVIILDTDDIFTFNNSTDANSGFRSAWVNKIRLRPSASGDGVQFQTLQKNSTPTLAVAEDTYSVTSTYRITDDSAGGVFSGASAGDWAYIKHSSSGNNLGWFSVTAVDGSSHYIDVAYGTRALTNDTNANYIIDIFTPELAIVLVSPTGDTGGASIETEEIDFGPKGRHFNNLAMYALSSSATVDVFLA